MAHWGFDLQNKWFGSGDFWSADPKSPNAAACCRSGGSEIPTVSLPSVGADFQWYNRKGAFPGFLCCASLDLSRLPLGVFLYGGPGYLHKMTFTFVVDIQAHFSLPINSTKRLELRGHLITFPCNTRSLAEPLQLDLAMLMHYPVSC